MGPILLYAWHQGVSEQMRLLRHACRPIVFAVSGLFLIVRAVDAHVFGWPLIVQTVCDARTPNYRDCVTVRQFAVKWLFLEMAMRLNDARIYYIVFVSAPASAVPDTIF